MTSLPRQLFTTMTEDHELVLTVEPLTVDDPGPDEIVVAVQATPINPSDLGLLVGPADLSTARRTEVDGHPALVASLHAAGRRFVAGRLGQKLSAGNEGAGLVVAAGASDAAQSLLGRTVTAVGGAMYRTHRVVKARRALPLPQGAAAAEGASLFVNPMTVQAFLTTMRAEGHTGIVHTAAASNLGQMLAKHCGKEGVPLVAIVRRASQRELLEKLGVPYVVDSSMDSFFKDLVAALVASEATLCFDAVGGGDLANTVLTAMEVALRTRGVRADIYGTPVLKQVYQYGRLDVGPTKLTPAYGMYWGVGGWLLTPRLHGLGRERTLEMQKYAIEERNGIFASEYARTVSLDDLLDPDTLRAIHRKGTNAKVLVDPSRAR
ncbi:MAG: NADH oxidase [Deltaproteobacteria bacterium]|nr:NADH oxidase [Deltaproteobacteria bacterium]